ncbi:MAG: hypothetical protein K0Q72_254 [Armatimonadetes bacterium]|jgi:hypothetical protein|nr:hypothetical protein [Armatimonadota bacterium]
MSVCAAEQPKERKHAGRQGLRLVLLLGLLVLVGGATGAACFWRSPIYCGPVALAGPHCREAVLINNVSVTTKPTPGRRGTWSWKAKTLALDVRKHETSPVVLTNKRIWKLGMFTLIQR